MEAVTVLVSESESQHAKWQKEGIGLTKSHNGKESEGQHDDLVVDGIHLEDALMTCLLVRVDGLIQSGGERVLDGEQRGKTVSVKMLEKKKEESSEKRRAGGGFI